MPAELNADDFGRVVHVEFDYTYKANDGRTIEITEGSEYVLVKKSNEDWWQVIDEGQKKPLYVPAAYMKELHQKKFLDHPFFKRAHKALLKAMNRDFGEAKENSISVPKKLMQHIKDGESSKERIIAVTGSREDLSVPTGFAHPAKLSEMRASTDSLDKFIENENPYDIVPAESLALPRKSFRCSADKDNSPCTNRPQEFPYENIANFAYSGECERPTVHHTSNSPLQDSKTGKTLPEVSKKPSHHPNIPYSIAQDNLQGISGMKPSAPSHYSPLQSTTTEALEDTWELQLDHETGNRYYFNPKTGRMSVTPHRKSHELCKQTTVQKPSPELPGALVSNSPHDIGQNKSLSPSLLRRRKASPARYKNLKTAPYLQRSYKKETDDRNVSPNGNNCNNIPLLIQSSPTPSLGNSETDESPFLNTQQQASYSRVSLTLSQSDTGPILSPSPIRTEASPTPPGWVKERSSDGDTSLVNSSDGVKWFQYYDASSGNFYYYNEQTGSVVWNLPEVEDNSSSPNDTVLGDDKQLSRSRKSFSQSESHCSKQQKSRTLDRGSFAGMGNADFPDKKSKSSSLPWPKARASKSTPSPPDAILKPRKGRSNEKTFRKRMLHSQSLIVLDDKTDIGKYSSHNEQQRSESEVIKQQGRLKLTKLTEAGRKTKKNWVQQWVVLFSKNLVFYKDQKQAMMTKTNPLGKPDSSCELYGGSIEWTKDKSSKKNVFQIDTVQGFSFLLQHDDATVIADWYKSIEAAIKKVNQEEPLHQVLMVTKDGHCSSEDESMENNHQVDAKDRKKKEKEKKKRQEGKTTIQAWIRCETE